MRSGRTSFRPGHSIAGCAMTHRPPCRRRRETCPADASWMARPWRLTTPSVGLADPPCHTAVSEPRPCPRGREPSPPPTFRPWLCCKPCLVSVPPPRAPAPRRSGSSRAGSCTIVHWSSHACRCVWCPCHCRRGTMSLQCLLFGCASFVAGYCVLVWCSRSSAPMPTGRAVFVVFEVGGVVPSSPVVVVMLCAYHAFRVSFVLLAPCSTWRRCCRHVCE